jgi:hypothetical protein
MKKSDDRSRLLNELYNVSKMGMEVAEIILPQTCGKKLREQIRRQDESYINLMERARAMMKTDGNQPEGIGELAQKMLRGSIKMKTFLHHDPQHIADLMVRGTTMGIVNMTKAINHTPDCDAGTKRFAEDCLRREEENVDKLKEFL